MFLVLIYLFLLCPLSPELDLLENWALSKACLMIARVHTMQAGPAACVSALSDVLY